MFIDRCRELLCLLANSRERAQSATFRVNIWLCRWAMLKFLRTWLYLVEESRSFRPSLSFINEKQNWYCTQAGKNSSLVVLVERNEYSEIPFSSSVFALRSVFSPPPPVLPSLEGYWSLAELQIPLNNWSCNTFLALAGIGSPPFSAGSPSKSE